MGLTSLERGAPLSIREEGEEKEGSCSRESDQETFRSEAEEDRFSIPFHSRDKAKNAFCWDTLTIYHAAAVLASNLVATQLDVTTDPMRRAGLTSPDTKNEIAELARSAVRNWSDRVGADRFTGPIARGDLALVRSHLTHLASDPSALRIYIAAGLALCRAILEARPDDYRVREIEALLTGGDLP